mmetsp:Transcript_3677/g.2194  ORF Transcript_3677/g.2194 Transcript_3677/m.2194 type:complete len:106 (-) Transcript_3677:376-693(-)
MELGLPPPPDKLLPPSYSINLITAEHANDTTYIPKDACTVPMIENTLMTPKGYDRDIRHYVFDINGRNMEYETGDILAIYPRNNKESVLQFLDKVGINANECYEA